MSIPDIVKAHVLKNCGRMPETQEEIDQYLDLINHAKKYEASLVISKLISKKYMKKFGIKSPAEIMKEGKTLFQQTK